MTRSIILTVTAILTVLIVSITACGIDASIPEGTVKAYLKAWESPNAVNRANFHDESSYNVKRVLKNGDVSKLDNQNYHYELVKNNNKWLISSIE
ncbi:hypothetical protein ACFLVP_00295 [Chloroflexota bacterium]